MSRDIYAKVVRAGTQIYANEYFQVDNMGPQEAAYYGGASPYMRYQMYALANLDIRQSDLIIDNTNIDPKTNELTQYRVISSPEPFPDSHMEIVSDLYRGT
jgi:hypothetical protein